MAVGVNQRHVSSMMVTGLDAQETGRDNSDEVRDITLLNLLELIKVVGVESQVVKTPETP